MSLNNCRYKLQSVPYFPQEKEILGGKNVANHVGKTSCT